MPSLESARPRLELSVNGTGPVPNYQPPHPEERQRRLEGPAPTTPHPEALEGHPEAIEGHPEPAKGPHPEPVEGPTGPQLLALHRQLSTFRSECYADIRARETRPLCFVPHGDLDWLNHELAGVRLLNAALPHHLRSPRVANWPHPVLPPRRLLSPRDVLPALDLALGVLARTAERRRLELTDA